MPSGGCGVSADEAAPKTLEAAYRAFNLDETLADAHSALAFTRVQHLHEWTSAEKKFRWFLLLDTLAFGIENIQLLAFQ
jgi:hypothetical protein